MYFTSLDTDCNTSPFDITKGCFQLLVMNICQPMDQSIIGLNRCQVKGVCKSKTPVMIHAINTISLRKAFNKSKRLQSDIAIRLHKLFVLFLINDKFCKGEGYNVNHSKNEKK